MDDSLATQLSEESSFINADSRHVQCCFRAAHLAIVENQTRESVNSTAKPLRESVAGDGRTTFESECESIPIGQFSSVEFFDTHVRSILPSSPPDVKTIPKKKTSVGWS